MFRHIRQESVPKCRKWEYDEFHHCGRAALIDAVSDIFRTAGFKWNATPIDSKEENGTPMNTHDYIPADIVAF
jgi:hypothetical protein